MKIFTRITMGGTLLAALLMAAGPVHGLTLTFDDAGLGHNDPVTAGYGTLNWSNFRLHNDEPAGTGYDVGIVSGDYAIFNVGAAPASISSLTDFDFTSAYMTAAWNIGLNITVAGYNNGSLLYSETVIANSSGPALYTFDYFGVDEVTFTSFGGIDDGNHSGSGAHFVMDNVVINESAPVPEPATLMLLGMGLTGLAVRQRRRA